MSLLQWPDDQRSSGAEDYEEGGIAIQDSSAGSMGWRWHCYADSQNILVQRDGSAPVALFSNPGIVELAFAFDQNMRPNVAYSLANDRVYLRWFDSQAQQYATTDLGPAKYPRMSLDDKRASQASNSDVILAYLRDGSLYYRLQRDRYGTEYMAATGLASTVRLRNIGLGKNLRFQFELA